jgi:putative transcriptional regulator
MAGGIKMPDSNLSNQIRRLRFENGEMTQEQLAERVGVTRQTIIAIEAGKYAPSLPLAFRIARNFNMPIEAVFQYKDSQAGAPQQ